MRLRYLAFAVTLTVPAWADTAYSSLPAPLPFNEPSVGYEANGLSEFGNLIALSSGPAVLYSATVALSDQSLESNFAAYVGQSLGGSNLTLAGFDIELTLNLYNVGAGDTVGSAIGSYTVDAFIPWRPEASADCSYNQWRAPDGCHTGLLTTVTFALPNVSVPGEFIYGLAFNTHHYGYSPTGVAGPYGSLNFAVTLADPSVGSNPDGKQEYATNSVQTSLTAAGQDDYIGEVEFDSVPEPSGMALAGTGLLSLFLFLRRARGRLNPHGNPPPGSAR